MQRLKYLGVLGGLGLLGLWKPGLGWLTLLSLFVLLQHAPPKSRSAEPRMTEVGGRGQDKGQDDAAKLAGAWACVSGANDGQALAEATVQALRLTMTKDGGYKTERGQQVLFDSTYKIDPAKQPKHIDLIGTEGENKGKAAQGIYALEGDTLKICYTMPGKERPTTFESKPGSGATLVVWKRLKS